MKLFTLADSQTEQYKQPFAAINPQEATRLIKSTCRQRDSLLHTCPEDFSLIQIGTFDTETGELTSTEKVVILADLTSLIEKTDNDPQL